MQQERGRVVLDYYDGLLNEPGNRTARTLNLLVEGSTSFWARDAGPRHSPVGYEE
jgi:hypothetical protein